MPFAVEIISAAGDLTGRESCIKQVLMLDEIFPVFRVDRLLELRGGDRLYRHIQRLIEIMVELEYAVAVSECEISPLSKANERNSFSFRKLS